MRAQPTHICVNSDSQLDPSCNALRLKNLVNLSPILVATLLLSVAAHAQDIPISSYSYNTGPSGSYPDTGGIELRNGVTDTIVWNGSNSPTAGNVAPLVGWQFSNPNITFSLGSAQTIRKVTIWFADSNGAAGVRMPASVTLTAGSFSQNFIVTDPSGAGTTVPVEFTGFEVTSSSMNVLVNQIPSGNWVMLSEVQFSAIPEPSAWAALAGTLALASTTLRRRR